MPKKKMPMTMLSLKKEINQVHNSIDQLCESLPGLFPLSELLALKEENKKLTRLIQHREESERRLMENRRLLAKECEVYRELLKLPKKESDEKRFSFPIEW